MFLYLLSSKILGVKKKRGSSKYESLGNGGIMIAL
jgi:hypothetical protein